MVDEKVEMEHRKSFREITGKRNPRPSTHQVPYSQRDGKGKGKGKATGKGAPLFKGRRSSYSTSQHFVAISPFDLDYNSPDLFLYHHYPDYSDYGSHSGACLVNDHSNTNTPRSITPWAEVLESMSSPLALNGSAVLPDLPSLPRCNSLSHPTGALALRLAEHLPHLMSREPEDMTEKDADASAAGAAAGADATEPKVEAANPVDLAAHKAAPPPKLQHVAPTVAKMAPSFTKSTIAKPSGAVALNSDWGRVNPPTVKMSPPMKAAPRAPTDTSSSQDSQKGHTPSSDDLRAPSMSREEALANVLAAQPDDEVSGSSDSWVDRPDGYAAWRPFQGPEPQYGPIAPPAEFSA